MAARKIRKVLSEEWSERISAGVIMDRLLKHVNGEIELKPTQVNAAAILLKKIVPDLTSADLNANIEVNMPWAERLIKAQEALKNVK